MKPMKKRLLSLLLTLVTILSLLPTSAFAASKTGSGIQITQDQAYWSTRLLANGTPYSYRPPLADGKLVYCMDSGLGYHYATKSFLDSYSWTSGSGADADAVLQSALTNSGLSEMDAMTVENVKWMMTYLNDCKDSNVGQLFMAVQTYVWENQSYKGEPSGDGDAGGYANADTYELYLSLIDNLLAKKAAEDAEFLKQIEAYKAQGIEASIVEDESAKWAVFAISSNRKNQSFFNYYGPRKLSVGEAKPDQPEQPVGGTGKITLTKTAAGTLKGLPGARYSIYFNGQIVGSDVTNESGELHIENAATGLWTFIETDAPSGFCVDPTPKSVYVDASEGDREYTVAAVNYAMMVLFGLTAGMGFPFYLIVLGITILFPVIPGLLGTMFGTQIYRILKNSSARIARLKAAAAILILFAFMIFMFCKFPDIAAGNFGDVISTSTFTLYAGQYIHRLLNGDYLLIGIYFGGVFLIGVTLLYGLIKIFRNWYSNDAIQGSKSQPVDWNKQTTKQHSPVSALLERERTRYFSLPVYLTNTACGLLFAAVFVLLVVLMSDKITPYIYQLAEYFQVPFADYDVLFIYAFSILTTISCTTYVSISIEGKQIEILKSLPIAAKCLFRVKLLHHLSMSVPTIFVLNTIMALYLQWSLGQFTRNYTQTTKRGLLTTNKG